MFPHLDSRHKMIGIHRPQAAGGFFQPASAEICARRQALIDEALSGKSSFSALTLNDFQIWAELNWKKEYNSVAALRRFIGKFDEESVECLQALNKLEEEKDLSAGPPSSPDKDAVSELGDVLWCLSALASIEKIDLQRATAHYLLDETGAIQLNFSFETLDKLMSGGFKPRLTRHMCNDEDDVWWDLRPAQTMPILAMSISASAGALLDRSWGEDLLSTPIWGRDTESTGQLYAQMAVFLAWYSHRWAGSSISEVVRKNVEKLSLRVQTGHIDRTDGTRAQKEL